MKVERLEEEGRVKLFVYDFDSLEVLLNYENVDFLHLEHFPQAEPLALEPILKFKELKELSLWTSTGWDGSGKTLSVKSFSPLVALEKLESLSVIDVVPLEGGVSALKQMVGLQKIVLGRKFYQLEDYAAIKSANPKIRGAEPIKQMNFFSGCKKCRAYPKLFLQGAKPRASSYVCPKCNKALIQKHLKHWAEVGGTPDYHEFLEASPESLLEKFGNPERLF